MSLERDVAVEAVTRAATLCQRVQAEMVQEDSLEKRDRSPVTVADFGSQALICRAIAEAFPHDVIVAEEDSAALRNHEDLLDRVTRYVSALTGDASPEAVCAWIDRGGADVGPRFWTLDPIDGTKGFLRRDQYAIALALVVEGTVQLGVLACPNLPFRWEVEDGPRGCLFIAERGQGAVMSSLDGTRRKRLENPQPARRFAESFESAHGDHATHVAIAQRLGITAPPIRIDSQAKYGLVARGDAAIYLRLPHPETPDYRECIWDHAAGTIVVEEAGGHVSDAEGRPFDLLQGRRMTANRGVVVTHGLDHGAVIACIREITGAK